MLRSNYLVAGYAAACLILSYPDGFLDAENALFADWPQGEFLQN